MHLDIESLTMNTCKLTGCRHPGEREPQMKRCLSDWFIDKKMWGIFLIFNRYRKYHPFAGSEREQN